MAKKETVNPALERAVEGLMKQVQSDTLEPGEELEAKLKVIDRAFKLEALRLKVKEDDAGSEFDFE